MRVLPAILLLSSAVAACDATGPSGAAPVPLARLAADSASYEMESAILTPAVGIVRSQAAWDSLFVRIEGNRIPSPVKGPALSFFDSSLVYVAIGPYPDPRYRVILDSAATFEGTLEVYFTDVYLDGCGVATVAVAPVDVAQVPRWTGPTRFVRRFRTIACT